MHYHGEGNLLPLSDKLVNLNLELGDENLNVHAAALIANLARSSADRGGIELTGTGIENTVQRNVVVRGQVFRYSFGALCAKRLVIGGIAYFVGEAMNFNHEALLIL